LLRAGRNQHLLVLDETWQVLADPGIGRWLRATMKLARAFGAAVVLVTTASRTFARSETNGAKPPVSHPHSSLTPRARRC